MLKIGLTGSIGSGKTLVSAVFRNLGVPVYNADLQAKRMLAYPYVIGRIRKEFGDKVINSEGEIDRRLLAAIVFPDNIKLEKLNQLIHPLVKGDFFCWTSLFHSAPYIIHEAAILYESGFYRYFDKVIMVTAPETLRIKRVMERDNVSEITVRQRIQYQWPDGDKLKLADFVIDNEEKVLLLPEIVNLHQQLIDS
ncbi:MAG: dephospho-CoA kinase [Bacteroidetes bacterium]|nr:dephospho-CoA kinase [Bacteroidota bacterium]